MNLCVWMVIRRWPILPPHGGARPPWPENCRISTFTWETIGTDSRFPRGTKASKRRADYCLRMVAVVVICLVVEMPPSATGSGLTPTLPQVSVTVTDIDVPEAAPTTVEGLVVTV